MKHNYKPSKKNRKSYRPTRLSKANKQKKYYPMIEVYRGYLAGVGHYDYLQVEDKLKSGAKVSLIGEPNNKYDAKAIRVELDGTKLGYISRNGDANRMLWTYKEKGAKFDAKIASYNKNNPSYTALSIVVYAAEPAPDDTSAGQDGNGHVAF